MSLSFTITKNYKGDYTIGRVYRDGNLLETKISNCACISTLETQKYMEQIISLFNMHLVEHNMPILSDEEKAELADVVEVVAHSSCAGV